MLNSSSSTHCPLHLHLFVKHGGRHFNASSSFLIRCISPHLHLHLLLACHTLSCPPPNPYLTCLFSVLFATLLAPSQVFTMPTLFSL